MCDWNVDILVRRGSYVHHLTSSAESQPICTSDPILIEAKRRRFKANGLRPDYYRNLTNFDTEESRILSPEFLL